MTEMHPIQLVIVGGVIAFGLVLTIAAGVEAKRRFGFWLLRQQVARQARQQDEDIEAKLRADFAKRARDRQALRELNNRG